MVEYSFSSLNNKDFIEIDIFGKQRKIKVFCTGDNKYDENGCLKKEQFALNQKELEVLNWLVNNVNLEDFKNQIIEYCNSVYEDYGGESITEKDLENEIYINKIAVNVSSTTQSKSGAIYPEISFLGECECDPDGGICIAFRDKKFIGISSQDWTL